MPCNISYEILKLRVLKIFSSISSAKQLALEKEGIDIIAGIPGGANLPLYRK